MTTCNSRRSLWTVVMLALLFAAFIGGTQVPIQFSIGRRAEYVPVSLVGENQVTSAGFNTPAVPPTIAFNDVVMPPVVPSVVEQPVVEPPTLNATPVSLPPVVESETAMMPPVVTPPTPIPPQLEKLVPLPDMPRPRPYAKNDDNSTTPMPPIVHTPEPIVLKDLHASESCLKHSIDTNLQRLASAKSQRATTEDEIAEIATALKQRLNWANEELKDQDASSDKPPVPQSRMGDKSIDQLIGHVRQLRANNAKLDGQIMTLRRVIRTQFDEIQKQVTNMGIMDAEPLSKPPVPLPPSN